MKSVATFVLVVLLCVPAMAQYGGMGGLGGAVTQAKSIDLELLEMEQEADKAALKEALLLQARQGMKPVSGTEAEQRQASAEAAELRDFIATKKQAVIKRAGELSTTPAAGSSAVNRGERGEQRGKAEQQGMYERYAEAQVNSQLLEAQIALLQDPLNAAIQALAAAEVAASNDDTKAAKVEATRKEFEKVKAIYVGYNKKLQMEKLGMRLMGGIDGMGGGMGGMGGMGGGFR